MEISKTKINYESKYYAGLAWIDAVYVGYSLGSR